MTREMQMEKVGAKVLTKLSRIEFFTGLANVPPSFTPSWTAGYSNMGYQILAYALEAITQKGFAQMLQSDVINKLGLQNTFYQKPNDSLGIIPQGAQNGFWSYSLGEASPYVISTPPFYRNSSTVVS